MINKKDIEDIKKDLKKYTKDDLIKLYKQSKIFCSFLSLVLIILSLVIASFSMIFTALFLLFISYLLSKTRENITDKIHYINNIK
jgi:hypothetical protein